MRKNTMVPDWISLSQNRMCANCICQNLIKDMSLRHFFGRIGETVRISSNAKTCFKHKMGRCVPKIDLKGRKFVLFIRAQADFYLMWSAVHCGPLKKLWRSTQKQVCGPLRTTEKKNCDPLRATPWHFCGPH